MTTHQHRHGESFARPERDNALGAGQGAEGAKQKSGQADYSIPHVYCFVDDIIAIGENGGMSACHLDEEKFVAAMLQWRERKRAEYETQFAYWQFKRRLMRGES